MYRNGYYKMRLQFQMLSKSLFTIFQKKASVRIEFIHNMHMTIGQKLRVFIYLYMYILCTMYTVHEESNLDRCFHNVKRFTLSCKKISVKSSRLIRMIKFIFFIFLRNFCDFVFYYNHLHCSTFRNF